MQDILLTDFDPADYLDTAEARAAYLTEAMASGDAAHIADALGVVARAHGMSALAADSGIARGTLYKALSADGNPTLATVTKLAETLGLRLQAVPLRQ